MTTRKLLVEDMQGMEDILLALEGLREEIPERTVIRALSRAVYHLLEDRIRKIDEERRSK